MLNKKYFILSLAIIILLSVFVFTNNVNALDGPNPQQVPIGDAPPAPPQPGGGIGAGTGGIQGGAATSGSTNDDPEHLSAEVGSGKLIVKVNCKCGIWKGFFHPICNLVCTASQAVIDFVSWVGNLFNQIPE